MPAKITAVLQTKDTTSVRTFSLVEQLLFSGLFAFACALWITPAAKAAESGFNATTATVIQIARDLRRPQELSPTELGVAKFYRQRSFEPAWLSEKRLTEVAQLTVLAQLHGLSPDDYGFMVAAHAHGADAVGYRPHHHARRVDGRVRQRSLRHGDVECRA